MMAWFSNDLVALKACRNVIEEVGPLHASAVILSRCQTRVLIAHGLALLCPVGDCASRFSLWIRGAGLADETGARLLQRRLHMMRPSDHSNGVHECAPTMPSDHALQCRQ